MELRHLKSSKRLAVSFLLTLSIIMMAGQAFGQQDLSNGLLAWWPFEEDASDASGNHQDGTLMGDAKIVEDGRVGGALYLDGEGDYVKIGKGLNLTDEFTVAAWIRAEDIDRKYPNIISKYETNTEGPYDFAMDYDRVKLGLSENGSYRAYYSTSSVPQDRWVHIAWVGSKQNFRIYINGEIDSRHRIAPMTSNEDLVCIGRQAFMFEQNGDLEFKGFIDELRAYDRALNEYEIRALFRLNMPLSREWVIVGNLRDAKSKKGIRGTVIVEDATTGEEIIRTNAEWPTGAFQVRITGRKEVSISAEAEGYLPGGELVEDQKFDGTALDISLHQVAVGTEVRLDAVYFVGGTAGLLTSSNSTLDRLVKFLDKNPRIHIEISGHTDGASDDDDWKLKLSGARAEAVKDYLTDSGIEGDRITTKAWADQKPVASNATKESRKLNRRVEFRITRL